MAGGPFSRPIPGTSGESQGIGCGPLAAGVIIGFIGVGFLIRLALGGVAALAFVASPAPYVQDLTEQETADLKPLSEAHVAALAKLHDQEILTAEQLKTDPTLATTREQIRAVRAEDDRFFDQVEARIEKSRQALLKRWPKADSEQARAFAEYNRLHSRPVNELRTVRLKRREALDELDAAARLLQRNRGRWKVMGQDVVFHGDRILDEFNARMARVRQLNADIAQAKSGVIFMDATAVPPPEEVVVTVPRKR